MISIMAMPKYEREYHPQVIMAARFPADYGIQMSPVSLCLAEDNEKYQFHI